MPDITRDPALLKRRRLRRIGSAMAVALVLITVSIAVARMEPAPPTADAATLVRDTVKRGSLVQTVRGSGTLVPEDSLDLGNH
jgi:multidrug efflux pump subunit AcrA (membrane-fusion protein)